MDTHGCEMSKSKSGGGPPANQRLQPTPMIISCFTARRYIGFEWISRSYSRRREATHAPAGVAQFHPIAETVTIAVSAVAIRV
jgi:hypothetical protein